MNEMIAIIWEAGSEHAATAGTPGTAHLLSVITC